MGLDPMEEEIVTKIDDYQLDRDDGSIYTKIKTVILERSIKKKKMNSNDELENLDVSSSFSTSTPKLCRSIRFDDMSCPSSADCSNSSHSRHTFLMDGSSIENDRVLSKPTKTQLVSKVTINVNKINPSRSAANPSPNVPLKSRKAKRNFIAENIRNASQGKRTPRISKNSTKFANRSQSAPRLHIDDLRSQRHNAIFDPRPFASQIELGVAPASTSSESSDDGEPIAVDLRKLCQNIVDCAGTSNENTKMVELTDSVTELKSVVDRYDEQMGCLFLEKMEKEIDEIFNLQHDIGNDNAEHKEEFEKKIAEETERLQQLDLDLSGNE